MAVSKYLMALALVSLAACTPTGGSNVGGGGYRAPTSAGQPPSPGRTDAQRRANRDYYRGPRGHEF